MNPRDPLTPEERELARLLGGRLDKAPPAAVDAAVLEAARAAVQPGNRPAEPAATTVPPAVDAPRRQHRRARWPAAFGVAASVVFAIGLAWQLRPEPEPPPQAAAVAAPAASAARALPAAVAGKEDAAKVAGRAPPAEPVKDAGPAPATDTAAPAPSAAPAEDAAGPPPALLRRAPAAPRDVVPPPPPVPASPAAFGDVVSSTDTQDAVSAEAMPSTRAPSAKAPATAARSLRSAPAIAGAPTAAHNEAAPGLSAQQVEAAVLADSRLTRRQWLQAIRDRRDAGEADLARASLERYLLQYPETRLPRDLRPLLVD